MTLANRPAGGASRAPWLAVAVLTVLGFALRVVGMDQSLYNDERFTFSIVTQHSLPGVIREVYRTSVTPPLNYVLAWLSVHLPGDDTVLVRLPSLLFGTAMVPLIFVLARRIGGIRTGLLAAALFALSPFAIYYSNEARTYEVMLFLVTLSTLALLRALEGGDRRWRWWAVYAIAACLAMYSHYTAVFALAAQVLWAAWVHRERLAELVYAQVAVVVGYLPWIPGYVKQRQNNGVEVLDQFSTESFRDIFEMPVRTLVGHPFVGLEQVPGRLALLLVLALAALLVAALVRRPSGVRELLPSLRSERGLILILALATPVGLLLYGRVSTSLYGVRNLSASQPALIVLVALLVNALLTTLPARVAAAAAAVMVVVLGVVAVQSIRAENLRPPYREAAEYLNQVAGPGDPVVYEQPLLGADARLGRTSLEPYIDHPGRVYLANDSAAAWAQVPAGRTLYLVSTRQKPLVKALGLDKLPAGLRRRQAQLGGPDGRAVERSEKTFEGFDGVIVRRFRGEAEGRLEQSGGRQVISWTLGRRVSVAPRRTRGLVQLVSPPVGRAGAASPVGRWRRPVRDRPTGSCSSSGGGWPPCPRSAGSARMSQPAPGHPRCCRASRWLLPRCRPIQRRSGCSP